MRVNLDVSPCTNTKTLTESGCCRRSRLDVVQAGRMNRSAGRIPHPVG